MSLQQRIVACARQNAAGIPCVAYVSPSDLREMTDGEECVLTEPGGQFDGLVMPSVHVTIRARAEQSPGAFALNIPLAPDEAG